MLAPLDLSNVFAGEFEVGDYFSLRPKLMASLDPVEFLKGSVKVSEGETLEEGSAAFFLNFSAQAMQSLGGDVSPASLEILRRGFQDALTLRLSSREVCQIWYCLRTLGAFPTAEVAKEILGVSLETFSGRSPFLLYCDSDNSSFGLWDGGVGRFPWYMEGEAAGLVSEILVAAQAFLDLAPLEDVLPSPPEEGEFLVTVLTPSGWRSLRLLEAEADTGPMGVMYAAFARLRVLFSKEFGCESEASVGFSFEDERWVYPSLWLRGLAFGVDALAYGAVFFLLGYGVYAFSGGLTLLSMWGLLLAALLMFPFYLSLFESSGTHTSFGKRFFSLYVVSTVRGTGAGFFQSLARNYCKCYLSWAFGWLWGLAHPYRRMFHDVFSDTVVIFDAKEAELLSQLKEELDTVDAG